MSTLRGMATLNYWADDVKAARDWYAKFLGVEAYFQRPDEKAPQYVEFRIGDSQAELGIVSRAFGFPGMATSPGGAVLYWAVDDLKGTLEKALSLGAKPGQPVTERGDGFVTATVIDPFGNIFGLMTNPHYLEMLKK